MSPGPRSGSLRIAQVSTSDTGGGAERVALDLHAGYQEQGHSADLWVGHVAGGVPATRHIDNDAARSAWARAVLGRPAGRPPGAVRRAVAEPVRRGRRLAGYVDLAFPATAAAADELGEAYDVVQLHNLHGDYFDLRVLPGLSACVPTVVTLHDAWLLSGHCAHSLGCERWRSGCGHCPDLTLPPAAHGDRTAANWRHKAGLYRDSRLHVTAPSSWLLDKVAASMLAPAVLSARVIPNGVDLSVFHPGDGASAARSRLGLPQHAPVVAFAAQSGAANRYKDFATVLDGAAHAAASLGAVVLVALGGAGPVASRPGLEVLSVPFTTDRALVAEYLRAADVYAHAARADTFPSVVLEALASGTPVVATAVGGIPEQLRPLAAGLDGSSTVDDPLGDGLLVTPADAPALGRALVRLLGDRALLARAAENAEREARTRFDVRGQVAAYLDLLAEVSAGQREGSRR